MKNRKGFTLIELIVSIALFGIVAVSLLSAFDTGLFNISRAGVRTINTYTAENVFLTSPVPVSEEQVVKVTLPTGEGEDEISEVNVTGRIGRGTGTSVGSYANVQVDIEAFVPGLDIDTEE